MGNDAGEGKGPQRGPQRRLDRRLEEVAKAVGGGYCRLQQSPTRFGGGGPLIRADWGSMFQAGVNWHKTGQGVGIRCLYTVQGPKIPFLMIVVHLQSFGYPTCVRVFGKNFSHFGLSAIPEQSCIRDVQYPSGVWT